MEKPKERLEAVCEFQEAKTPRAWSKDVSKYDLVVNFVVKIKSEV